MNYKEDHPERQPDEIYMGNWSNAGYYRMGWETKRRGVTPYNIHGAVIYAPPNLVFPAFIKKTEVERRIEKLKEERHNTDVIASLTEMLLHNCIRLGD